jgi:hypothetical protein
MVASTVDCIRQIAESIPEVAELLARKEKSLGAARAMIEAGANPQKVRILRVDLIRMCRDYVRGAAKLKAHN